MKVRYGSVCSGVEAASLAWHPFGWTPVFFSEIEPFPAAVLCERFGATRPLRPLDPAEAHDEKDRKLRESWKKQIAKLSPVGRIPNEGDFTKIGKKYHGKIDLLVGGTPCQDLSVAGKRAGFNGARSSLALDFVRLAYESGCKWFVWENVPGVFSSNGGGDFATLLSLFTGIEIDIPKGGFANAGFVCNDRRDRYGVAWRVLDAQFTRTSGFQFAVPQRRRRVFVVGYFGDWTRAAQVLLEYDRLQWNPPARIKARETITGNVGIGFNQTSRNYQITAGSGKSVDVSCTLDVKCKDGAIRNQQGMAIVESGKGFFNKSEIAGTLEQHEDQHRRNIICIETGQCCAACAPAIDVSTTLNCNHEAPIICQATRQGQAESMTDCCPTITAAADKSGNNQPIICAGFMGGQGSKAGGIAYSEEIAPTIKSSPSGGNTIPDIVCQYGNVAGTLEARHDSSPCADRGQNIVFAGCLTPHDSQSIRIFGEDGVFPTLKAGNKGGLNRQSIFCVHGSQDPIVQTDHANAINRNNGLENCVCIQQNQLGEIRTGNVCCTLNTNSNASGRNTPIVYENHAQDSRIKTLGGVCSQISTKAGTGGNNLPIVQECYPINSMIINKDAKPEDRQTTGIGNNGDPCPTIGTTQHHAVAIAENIIGRKVENGGNGIGAQEELAYTQNCSGVMGVCAQATVRRLTPLECERLMGFPDNHTRIPWKGKPEEKCPDSPRYKACGNSMCVNVMQWIGERINEIEIQDQEAAK